MTKNTGPATEPVHDLESLRRSGRLTITVDEACTLLGVDRRTLYKAMAAGEIPEVRVQARRLIPRLKFLRLFEDVNNEVAA
ncbi:helix-turn-helix domain-containing protein [Promicromonospora sp. NPDC057138]|uniref:helix-turn-helix domain-containing protein n=1 Tax=Promicromonospora sp. NPDC057138 TaxID=3346031 RepID=UPI003645DBE7